MMKIAIRSRLILDSNGILWVRCDPWAKSNWIIAVPWTGILGKKHIKHTRLVQKAAGV